MKNLTHKLASGVSAIAFFGLAAVMAGLGFAFIGVLALFALIGLGAALLATPFIKMAPAPVSAPQSETVSA